MLRKTIWIKLPFFVHFVLWTFLQSSYDTGWRETSENICMGQDGIMS